MADVERLINAIDQSERFAYGSATDSDLQSDRALAIDYYHGRNVEPAPEGRSQVVDRTVFETIQWILPSLCRIFANGDDIVQLQPFGPEDEEAARQESDYLNYLVTQKNRWFTIFLTWAQDALLSKNGYCMAYVEEKLHTELETYERQSDEALAMLLRGEGIEVVTHEAIEDTENLVPVADELGQPVLDPMTGQPMMQPRMLHTVTLRKSKPEKKLCFKVLPPERCLVDVDTESYTLEDCDYFEFWDIVTISHLRALGFDIPDDIGDGDEGSDSTEEYYARSLYGEDEIRGDNDVDPSMRKVRCRMVWIRHDYDEDGIAELMLCYRVGNHILEKGGKPAIYPVSRIPVASITPNVNTHRHIGTSEADITADLQRIKTAMLRQGLDGLYLAINPRHIVSDRVNLDDAQVSRPGGLVRLLDGALPGEGHMLPVTTENVFPTAIQGLEYMDQVRENRTGTNRYFAGTDQNALNTTASGIQQLSSMAAQRVEQIARIFASGVEYLFSVAHELVIKSGHQAEVVQLRGKWVSVDPSSWKTGRDMRIVVGYGAGNKDALVARLAMIRQAQLEAMQSGLRVSNEQNYYETMVELTKASDFTAPQRFWTDPSTLPPPEPPPPDPVVMIEGAKIQSAEKIKVAEMEYKSQESEKDRAMEKYKVDVDAELKILLKQLEHGSSVDIERVRGAMKIEPVEKVTQKLEADVSHKTESIRAELMAMLGDLAKRSEMSVKQLAEMLNAPREVVRGKDGRVSGVKVGGVERKVKRDADGKVIGLQ